MLALGLHLRLEEEGRLVKVPPFPAPLARA